MTDAAAVETPPHPGARGGRSARSASAVPTVAVIHGYCLGGGLEIALACDYRIAVEDARLGFPEVMLGLHPGLGGTVRLPRLINPLEAMTMMLTGRNVRARRAKSLGLVDAVVPERHVQGRRHRRRHGAAEDPARRPADRPRQLHLRAQARGQAHARGNREEGADRALSRAARADRSVGNPRRQRAGHAEGGDRLVRAPARHRDLAQPGARVLPAREPQEPRRRRLVRPPRPRHRRRRHGRRHRGLVRLARLHRHARRHEGRADRQGDRARRRPLRQDRPQAHRHPRRARPAHPRSRGRGRALRRPRDRGGAGDARAQAQGLRRDRAEDAAGRHPRHQHVEHSAAKSCASDCGGPITSSACISSIRCRACSWSRW